MSNDFYSCLRQTVIRTIHSTDNSMNFSTLSLLSFPVNSPTKPLFFDFHSTLCTVEEKGMEIETTARDQDHHIMLCSFTIFTSKLTYTRLLCFSSEEQYIFLEIRHSE